MAPRGAAGPASPSSPQTQLEGERKGVGISGPPARSSAPRSATPTPAPRRTTSAAPNPGEGRSGLSLAPVSLPCDHGRPLSPQRDSHGGRGPSVSGPASPLSRTPATPAAPRGGGQSQKTARALPLSPPSPGLRESGYLARGWGENTAQRRKRRRKTVASGPERFGKFGRLVPHWVTAARCARAPGSRRRSLHRSSPSRGEDGRQRRRRVHSASRLPLREGALVVT